MYLNADGDYEDYFSQNYAIKSFIVNPTLTQIVEKMQEVQVLVDEEKERQRLIEKEMQNENFEKRTRYYETERQQLETEIRELKAERQRLEDQNEQLKVEEKNSQLKAEAWRLESKDLEKQLFKIEREWLKEKRQLMKKGFWARVQLAGKFLAKSEEIRLFRKA